MMKRRIKIIALLLTVAIAAGALSFISGCKKKGEEVIKIGAILPLTGDIASYGQYAKNGLDMAVNEINNGGGISGKKIELIYQDDKNSAKDAVNIIDNYINIQQIQVIIGSAASSVTLAMAPIANKNHVILFTPISSSKDLTIQGGDFFFRPCPSDAYQSIILADWMLSLGIKKVAVIYVNNSWGKGLHDEFIEYYTKKKGSIIYDEAIEENTIDVKTQLAKAISKLPDAIFAPTYGKEGGVLVRQAKELGIRFPIFGGDVWSSPEFITSAGSATEGVCFTQPAGFKGPKYDTFVMNYKERFLNEPDTYAAYSYDTIKILALAMKAGNLTGESIRNYLKEMKGYGGVTGNIRFDKHGDVIGKTFSRFQYINGKVVEIR